MRKRLLLALLFGGFALPAFADEDAVTRAYELRMKGKVDEARELLDRTIAEEPDSAAALCELARVHLHIALGSPRDLKRSVGDALLSIEKATESDPKNATYHYLEGHLAFLRAYISLEGGGPDTKEHLRRACEAFDAALRIKPDCHQAMLHLIELYTQFPPESGGDRKKAGNYEKQLVELSKAFPGRPELAVSCARARSILEPELRGVDFWRDRVLKDRPGNADVLEELGKAHLGEDEVEDAIECFIQAVEKAPGKAYLFLDLAVYHTFRARMSRADKERFRTSLRAGDAAVTRYLDSKPSRPMQAYALGVQHKFKRFLGEGELATSLLEKAKTLDPYFSRAAARPTPLLFSIPGEIPRNHSYLMRSY